MSTGIGQTALVVGARRYEFDVVIVGGGGAGLAAAIEAATIGRSVVLLEKTPKLGGSTGRSVGSISATLTPYQIKKGIKDDPEAHFEDLGKFNQAAGFPDNEELRRVLTYNVPDTLRWLMSLGVRFYGPMPEPPHRHPRMHNVLPNSGAYIYHAQRRARRLGVDIRTHMRAQRLTMAGGRVVGLEAIDGQGRTHAFHAHGGVVLASGDYSASEEFKGRFVSPDVARIGPINPTNTGDGQLMGLEIGGKVLNGGLLYALIKTVPPKPKLTNHIPPWPWLTEFTNWAMAHLPAALLRPFVMSFLTTVLSISPKLIEAGAIMVNREGKRFGDEFQKLVTTLSKQTDQMAYYIFDAPIAKRFSGWPHYVSTAPGVAYAYLPDYRRSRRDIYFVANSIEELGRKMGFPPSALEQTVQQYNSTAEPGITPRGKRWREALTEPPFYALGPVRSVVNITDGGLAIDREMRVLGQDGRPIPGVYAAGSVGQGGLVLEGHGHHIGWAFTSGRIAGRNAALGSVTKPAGEA